MPESYFNTQTTCVVQHSRTVRRLLQSEGCLSMEALAEALELTYPQTLSVLQRMEENGEIVRERGQWQLVEVECA
jgi:DNA-binding MarR family transcriptional regulator